MFQLAFIVLNLCALTVNRIIQITYIEDPDTWVPFEPPMTDDNFNWSEHKLQAEATGLLLAGGAEFPWVVDIRLADQDQETWAVGNIITNFHVISTAKEMWYLSEKVARRPPSPQTYGITVNFCASYLWEVYDPNNPVREDFGGTRRVKVLYVHPEFNILTFEFDVSLLELEQDIRPKLPKVSYMPIPQNPLTGSLLDPDFKLQELNRWVCHIVSFGKNSNNDRDNKLLDHKVKYRVYHLKWEDCKKYFTRLCPRPYPFCNGGFFNRANGQLMCFRTHAKVGSVCDHDRGAPLVCDGFVFGMVVRGVEFKYCHNLIPFPALVRKIDFMVGYIANITERFGEKWDGEHEASGVDDDQNYLRAKRPLKFVIMLINVLMLFYH
ncbi:hypothetical protein GE061_009487 [Apolygus lucorum]|uniref:Peptidase S1 domain-containing protein n=1 Tax=Apolygus lucorum TaxID=248454 RepID=A0A8S9Y1M9_APOLU|nr:hypothetical protein GE061_009487 [Apolygus lucorum]